MQTVWHDLFQTGLSNYMMVLFGAAGLGWWVLHKQHQKPAWLSPGVIIAWLFVAVPSFLQVGLFPSMLTVLERNTDLIFHGEIWRLATALFVQAGGWQGLIFNLVAFYVLLAVSSRLLGWRRTALGFGLGWLGGEVSALGLSPIGAGNSIANFGIAAGILATLLLGSHHRSVRFIAVLVAILSIGSLGSLDVHSFAFTTAFVVLLVWNWHWPQKVRY